MYEFQRPDDPSELRNKLRDHLYTHLDFAKETAALECHPPCFFSTPEGNTGLCPPAAQENDVVVVLHGGNVPYILRSEKTECVHGEKDAAR